MSGKEYLNKKFGYIKKLSIVIIVINISYFYFKYAINSITIDINTIYIVSMGISVLSEEPYEMSEFSSTMMLMPEKIGNKIEDYNDNYWTLPNITPLPEWIRKQIRD